MMRILAGACGVVASIGGCGAVDMETHTAQVTGDVRGLWDGVDGVTLRLTAQGVDRSLTVSANGPFHFEPALALGTAYTVTIASNPANHACTIDAGGNGTAAASGAAVSVSCRGPDVDLTLSGPWAWTFDPAQDMQTLAASLMTREVAVTVSGSSLTGAVVAGIAATLGQPSAPLALTIGATTIPVALTARGGLSKTYQLVVQRGASPIEQIVYSKASNARANHGFGAALAIDGDTLAIGAPCESSSATGVGGNAADTSAPCAGAVYVFVRRGGTWSQQAYLKASNTGAGDGFGSAVALAGDTLAVGAPGEDSSAVKIDGNQADNAASDAGAAYVFTRSGTTWSQQAYLKASNTGADDQFGNAVALSGNTLAVGAHGEASAATRIDGNQADNTAPKAGAVYVFARTGVTWQQQAYVKASNAETFDELGYSVALAGDTLIAGAPGESSNAAGIGGDPANNAAAASGAVYVFVRTGTQWSQQAYVKASNPGAADFFGCSAALSQDTLAVGAYQESSAASGVDHDQRNDSAPNAGAAYVFVRSGATWRQQAYVKASNAEAGDLFGWSVALAGDTLVAGAYHEASAAIGVDHDQNNNAVEGAGAAYLFTRSGTTWEQRAYLKASNSGAGDLFGWAVAASGDALAVAAQGESSAIAGINPVNGERDNSAADAGAVYLFR